MGLLAPVDDDQGDDSSSDSSASPDSFSLGASTASEVHLLGREVGGHGRGAYYQ